MADSGNKGIKRIILAAGYSWRGFSAAYKNEEAFRQELFLGLILIPLAFYLTRDAVELVLLIGSVLLVWMVEILNSAIEALVDRLGSEHHELSGRAKDMGSAAVFVALCNVVLAWCCILFL